MFHGSPLETLPVRKTLVSGEKRSGFALREKLTKNSSREEKMGKILIIDDDEMLLEALRKLLSDSSHRVVATADGPQGIELYKNEHPDVVLLDLALPTMSSIKVLNEIRRYDIKAKVIVFTGYESVETAVLALRHGAVGYHGKADKIDLLLKKIDTASGNPSK